MCLYSKILPKKSRKARTCYKILWFFYSNSEHKHVLVSPYALQNMQKHIKAGFFEDNKKSRIEKDIFRDLYILGNGFIHTYENYEDALNNAMHLAFWNRGYMIIYKCEIPKDTEYCYGPKRYNMKPQYASKKINFIKNMDIIKGGSISCLKKDDNDYKRVMNYINEKTN